MQGVEVRAGRHLGADEEVGRYARELLTDEEYAELLRRMVQVLPNGPLLDYPQAFGEPSKN